MQPLAVASPHEKLQSVVSVCIKSSRHGGTMARRKHHDERNRTGRNVCWNRCSALSANDGKPENFRGVLMKKPNPRKRPATQADVEKAKKQATDDAVRLAMTIFLTVLKDKNGFSNEELSDTWANVESLSESIRDGYVSIYDLRAVLREEYEIYV